MDDAGYGFWGKYPLVLYKEMQRHWIDKGLMTRIPIPRRRKPVRKISAKQRARLARLAEIRHTWYFNRGWRTCGICKRLIMWYADYTLDHILPGKMGGCKDDSEDNLQPAHWWCNLEKGSKRV